MHRRTLVTSLISLSAGVTSAGCNKQAAAEDKTEIDVLSTAEEPYTVNVTVLSNGERVFKKQYELDAREGDLSESVASEPDEVRVSIDGKEEAQFEYRPPTECDRAEDEPKIVLTISDDGSVSLTYGCSW